MTQHIVNENQIGVRLDRFLVNVCPEFSRSFLAENVGSFVLVDGKKVKRSLKLKVGQSVTIDELGLKQKYEQEKYSIEEQGKIVAQKGEIFVFYEDEDYLVLKKQAGLVVHPGIGHRDDTLANYVKQYLVEKGEYDLELKRAGIVHRLDMPVSGLIVFAKNFVSQKHLMQQFESHSVLKIYYVEYVKKEEKKIFTEYGRIEDIYLLIEQYKRGEDLDLQKWMEVTGSMKRDPSNRKRMLFQRLLEDENLKNAKSYILPLSDSKMCVLIKTGRMHQIRATLKSLGLAIKGDVLYGWKGEACDEISLKSIVLGFVDRGNNKKVFNIINTVNG